MLNSSVEVWPVAGSPVNGRQDGVAPSTGFVIVGSFNASGMAEGTLRPAVGKVTTMRIHFSTQHGSNWVLLSEVSDAVISFLWCCLFVEYQAFSARLLLSSYIFILSVGASFPQSPLL